MRSIRIFAIAVLILTAHHGMIAAEEPRVPDANWPKWSPSTEDWINSNIPAVDLGGNLHALKVKAAGGSLQLVHVSSEAAHRALNDEDADSIREIVATSDGIGDAQIVATPDGVLHAYFMAPGVGTGVSTSTQVWYASRPVSGTWSAPIPLSTSGLFSEPGPTGGILHVRDDVGAIAASVDDSGNAVCYYLQHEVFEHSPVPDPSDYNRWGLWRSVSGGAGVEMFAGSASAGLHVISTAAPWRIKSHHGRLAILGATLGTDPGYKVRYFDGTGWYVIAVLTADTQLTATGLWVEVGVGGADVPHIVWRTTGSAGTPSTFTHATDKTAVVTETFVGVLDASVVAGPNGVLHRFLLKSGSGGAFTLTHSAGDPLAWSTEYEFAKDFLFTGTPVLSSRYVNSVNQFMVAVAPDGAPALATVFRSWEDNLGVQDPVGMVSAGPGASANLSNGNVFMSVPLFAMAGHGPVPAVALHYNSLSESRGLCGRGWSHTYDIFLTYRQPVPTSEPLPTSEQIMLSLGDGSVVVFKYDSASSGWIPDDKYGVSMKATYDPATKKVTIEATNESKMIFRADGRIEEIRDRDDNLLTFEYGANPDGATTTVVLKKVTDTYGRYVTFKYDARDRLDLVTDPSQKYHLVYDLANDQLTEIHFQKASGTDINHWAFEYSDTAAVFGRLTRIKTPPQVEAAVADDFTYEIVYHTLGNSVGRVQVVVDPEAEHASPIDPEAPPTSFRALASFTYSFTPIPVGAVTTFQTAYVDRHGNTFTLKLDYARSLALEIVDPENTSPTTRAFDYRRNLTSVVDPGGRTTTWTYGSEGTSRPWVKDLLKTALLPGDSAPTVYAYDATHSVVTTITPPSGHPTVMTLDGKGHVKTVTLPGNTNATVYDYNLQGMVTQVTDEAAHSTTYAYSPTPSYGMPRSITRHMQSPTPDIVQQFAYNVMGQMTSSITPGGGETVFEYGDLHNLTKKTLPSTGTGTDSVQYLFAPNGLLTKVLDPNSSKVEYAYNFLNEVTLTTNAADLKSKSVHTANGVAARSSAFVSDPESTSRLSFLKSDGLGRATESRSNLDTGKQVVSNFAYDGSSLLMSQSVSGTGGSLAGVRTTVTHTNPQGLVDYVTFPTTSAGEEIRVDYQYNDNRFVTNVELSWKPAEVEGSPTFFRGVHYVRDYQDRVTEIWELADHFDGGGSGALTGRKTSLVWSEVGTLDQVIVPITGSTTATTTLESDWAYRRSKVTDAEGVQVLANWTADSLPGGSSMKIPGFSGFIQPQVSVYDPRKRFDKSSDVLNPTVFFQQNYDGGNRPTTFTGPDGLYTKSEYNSKNQLTASIAQKDSGVLLRHEYEYQASTGDMTKRSAPPGAGGPFWSYSYDDGGRSIGAVTPKLYSSSAEYDALGQITKRTDEDGNFLETDYDELGRPIETRFHEVSDPPAEYAETISRKFDGAGNLLQISSAATGVTVIYSYVPFDGPDKHRNELTTVTWMMGATVWKVVRYRYDEGGRRTDTEVMNPDGETVAFHQVMTYDDSGRVLSVDSNGLATPDASFKYVHGILTETKLRNGTRISRAYDKKGRLKLLSNADASGQMLASMEYQYDLRDRRTSVYYAHLGLTSTFDYFDNSWLKGEHHHQSATAAPVWMKVEASFSGGNRSPETAEISATPGPTASGVSLDILYDYDLRGNRVTKDDLSGSTGDADYYYDVDDRLTHETRGGVDIYYLYANRGDLTHKTAGSEETSYFNDYLGRITGLTVGSDSWSYIYAPSGERLKKLHGSTSEEWYLSSDGDTLIDHTKSGTDPLLFSGIYTSPGTDGRLVRTDEFGVSTYFFGDALQSVHQVTNGTGTVVRQQFTDAWGNDISLGAPPTPTGPGDRYGFQGRESDTESGLQHFRARSYDPMIGRFTSRDPVPYPNLYIFPGNNPVNQTDPSGEISEEDKARLLAASQYYRDQNRPELAGMFDEWRVKEIEKDRVHGLGNADEEGRLWSEIKGLVWKIGNAMKPSATGHEPEGELEEKLMGRRKIAEAGRHLEGAGEALAQVWIDAGINAVLMGIGLGANYLDDAVDLVRGGDKLDDAARAFVKKEADDVAGLTAKVETNPQFKQGLNFWKTSEFRGTKVYTRTDLIDPKRLDDLGRSNLQRMEQGLAPLGPDGRAINLHHTIQTNDSPIAEVTATFHKNYSKTIHINPGNTVPSEIDRAAFDKWRQAYWMERAKDFK